MEGEKHNPIAILALVVVLVAVGLVVLGQRNISDGNVEYASAMVSVENTIMTNGILPPPPGFPSDIPLESGAELVESLVAHYPDLGKQSSVSYRSFLNISQKIAEYRNYLLSAGYSISEESQNSSAAKISAVRSNAEIFIIVTPAEEGNIVEVSYLLR